MRRSNCSLRHSSQRFVWDNAVAIVFTLAGVCLASPLAAEPPTTRHVEGLRENRPHWYALTGARVVAAPGKVLEDATIVVRDGAIVQVGGDVPRGAKRIDLAGKTIYAGLIDAYSETGISDEAVKRGAVYWNPQVRSHTSVASEFTSDLSKDKDYRSQGIVARLVAPDAGILRGQSAVVSTGNGSRDRRILRADVAQHALLSLRSGSRKVYPNSPMGAVALARQALYDAQWLSAARNAYQADRTLPRPERNDTLASLKKALDGQPMVFETLNELYLLRADRFAREFGLPAVMLGSGHEYKRLDAVISTARPVIVPVNFPKAPNVATRETERQATMEELMHWDLAPENPARLVKAGATIALTTDGLDSPKEFLKAVRQSVQRGLDKQDALRAMTTTPAKLFGVDQLLGTIEPGKQASFVVVDGDLFDDQGKIVETWVDGERFEMSEAPWFDLAGHWVVQISGAKAKLNMELKTKPKLSGKATLDAKKQESFDVTHVSLSGARLSLRIPGEKLGNPGSGRLSALLDASGQSWAGEVVWADDSTAAVTAKRRDPSELEDAKQEKADQDPDQKDAAPVQEKKDDAETASALFAVNFPLGAFGRVKPPEQQAVLFTNTTIWTSASSGVIKDGAVLIRDGRIVSVHESPPKVADNVLVVDLEGRHLTPGIIDCHSHMATDGGVNESAQTVTAEVRIGDFINCDDINIYRQLAGGVTSSNILHGSANPIGGQNQVIKLRWGALDEEMKFAEAPQGIKFALGENVKQSNWGDDYTTRYPQTRMGVVEFMRDTLQAGKEYRESQRQFQKRGGMPVRRDLELDAIGEILEGTRWIHCHSYRQDEILALIRTLDEYEVTIGTFQHILEGYKVADAMAKHGAMGSAFSDWWAYKYEVFDAIPFNGALMHRAGVVVSFNSDDRELARRLNLEAAKAVKYGGVEPNEALKFVTLNPAKQLRIDKHVGSIEPGKHADFAIWSGSPLSSYSRCEQTWIDGRKYFDRDEDAKEREEMQRRRAALVRKILDSGKPMLKPGERHEDAAALWPQEDEFCHHSGHGSGYGR